MILDNIQSSWQFCLWGRRRCDAVHDAADDYVNSGWGNNGGNGYGDENADDENKDIRI